MNPQQPPYQQPYPQQPGWQPMPGAQPSGSYPYQQPTGGYQPPAGQPWPPMPAPPAPKRHRKWPWAVGAVVLLLIIIGSTAKPSGPSTSTTPTVVNAGPVASRAQSAAAAPAPAAPAPAASTFGSGTYEVGTGDGQIPPGKYKSAGPDGSNFAGCYYARLRNNDGSLEDILSNNVTQGPSIFTAKPTDGYIEITGCSFTKA